jgi:hypothetical protein
MPGWIAAGMVVAAGISYYGARKSADARDEAAERAAELASEGRYEAQAKLDPWVEAGREALLQYKNVLAQPEQIRTLPGYQFGLDEGRSAILARASAGGKRLSGATLKGLERYSQDYADTKLQERLAPYYNLSESGRAAAGTQANLLAGTSNELARLEMAKGAAGADKYADYANIGSGLVSGLTNYYAYQNALTQQNQPAQPQGNVYPGAGSYDYQAQPTAYNRWRTWR